MAQGAGKLKSKTVGLKKEKHRVKKQQLKRGARYIAPKKAKRVQEEKLKKGLETAIKTNIEQEISVKVKSIESKRFHVVQTPSTSDSKSKDVANPSVKKK